MAVETRQKSVTSSCSSFTCFLPVFTPPGCCATPLLLPGVPALGPVPAGGRRPAVAAQLGGGAGPPASPGPHQQGAGPPAVAHLVLPHPGRAEPALTQ